MPPSGQFVHYIKLFSASYRSHQGRPRIEEDQPQLLQTILDIVSATSAADDRRRTEMLRTVTTLKDLTAELNLRGINIKETTAYYRLVPR